MTDEELDLARAKEANRLAWDTGSVALHAARLAREGWMPPDPLREVVERLYADGASNWWATKSSALYVLRQAVERGIEIGKAQR